MVLIICNCLISYKIKKICVLRPPESLKYGTFCILIIGLYAVKFKISDTILDVKGFYDIQVIYKKEGVRKVVRVSVNGDLILGQTGRL